MAEHLPAFYFITRDSDETGVLEPQCIVWAEIAPERVRIGRGARWRCVDSPGNWRYTPIEIWAWAGVTPDTDREVIRVPGIRGK